MLAAKGSLYVTRQTLFTHIATRESTQAMADDLFEAVRQRQGQDPHRPALSAGPGAAGAPRPGSAQDHRLHHPHLVSLAVPPPGLRRCAHALTSRRASHALRCGRATRRIGSVEPDFLRAHADAATACVEQADARRRARLANQSANVDGQPGFRLPLPCATAGVAHAWRDEQLAVTDSNGTHARHRRTRRGAAPRHHHLRRAP